MVSVVITTYNRANLVGRAIESVLGQSYPNLDVVVVDDGSTDNTASVLQSYVADPRVRVVTIRVNSGVTAAKNTGLDHVRGEFTALVDSDDELFPDAVETIISHFQSLGPDYGMVFGNCLDSASGEMTGRGFSENSEVGHQDAVCGRLSGDFWGLWRTSLLGSLRFDPSVPGHESLVWHELYLRAKVYYIHRPLQKCFREGTDRVSSLAYALPRARLKARGYQQYVEKFRKELQRCCPSRLARLLQIEAFYLLLAGDRKAASSALLQGWRAKPGLRSALPFGGLIIPRWVLQWVMLVRERR